MKVAIFQPTPFSTMNIFARAAEADAVIILNKAQMTYSMYDGHGNKKITGMKHILVGGCQDPAWIPIHVKNRMKPLDETELAENDWDKKILSSIKYRYLSSNYFENYIDNIDNLIHSSNILGKMSLNTFKWVHSELRLHSKIYNDFDLSDMAGTKGNWILDICKNIGATEYLTGAPGLNYLNLSRFEENKINIKIQDWTPIKYKQHKNTWNPNLSILDSMLYNGAKKTRSLLINGIR